MLIGNMKEKNKNKQKEGDEKRRQKNDIKSRNLHMFFAA